MWDQTAMTISIVAITLSAFLLVFFYSCFNWLKYKVNYDPLKELKRPLMQPHSITNLERTLILVRDIDNESGLVGKVIQRLETSGL